MDSNRIPQNLEELINIVKAEYDIIKANNDAAALAQEPENELVNNTECDQDVPVDDDMEAAAVTAATANGKKIYTISSTLVYILKKYRFWPFLQVKKFFSNKNLVLIHNTYKRVDVRHFQQIYDQCRSIVLDFSAPPGENIVVSYTQPIPERITDVEYMKIAKTNDVTESSYEGTVVTVYHYKGQWYFGTTSCPTIDSSRYFHPTKTHGMMLDETIAKITNKPVPTNREESYALRQGFANVAFDTTKAYAFVLVHYQNCHIIDYTSALGENYMCLVHIVTRSRDTYKDEDISSQPYASIGIQYPIKFATPVEAVKYIQTVAYAYAIIVKTEDGKILKVSTEQIIKKEEHNMGNTNPWYNMLHVYMQHNPTYKINDYIKEFDIKLTLPKSSRGIDMDPTYIIHTSMVTIRDFLFKFYNACTEYDLSTQRYIINKEADAKYAPIIRFHLVQLRNIQVTRHKHAALTDKAVYVYLCHNQTIKNLRLLIKYFATSWIQGDKLNGVPYRAAESLVELNKLMTDTA